MARGASLDCRKVFMKNNGTIRMDVYRISSKDLRFMDRISHGQHIKKVIIYGGDESFSYLEFKVISWKQMLSEFD